MDERLSLLQIGHAGNAIAFRCSRLLRSIRTVGPCSLVVSRVLLGSRSLRTALSTYTLVIASSKVVPSVAERWKMSHGAATGMVQTAQAYAGGMCELTGAFCLPADRLMPMR